MVIPTSARPERRDDADHRAQPPIRWPRPDRRSIGLFALWVVGLVVSVLVPAAFVPPTARTAPVGDLMLAFGSTLLGAAVMIGVAAVWWRRSKDSSVLVMGLVPAVAVVAGGVILTVSKLGGG